MHLLTWLYPIENHWSLAGNLHLQIQSLCTKLGCIIQLLKSRTLLGGWSVVLGGKSERILIIVIGHFQVLYHSLPFGVRFLLNNRGFWITFVFPYGSLRLILGGMDLLYRKLLNARRLWYKWGRVFSISAAKGSIKGPFSSRGALFTCGFIGPFPVTRWRRITLIQPTRPSAWVVARREYIRNTITRPPAGFLARGITWGNDTGPFAVLFRRLDTAQPL